MGFRRSWRLWRHVPRNNRRDFFFERTWKLLPSKSSASTRPSSRFESSVCVPGSESQSHWIFPLIPVMGSRRVLQTRSEVVLAMKLDDRPLAPNRAIRPNDLVKYDGVDRPSALSVCDSYSLTESPMISGLVPSSSACENPLPNQDFDFSTCHLELGGFSEELVDRSSVRHFFAIVIGIRHSNGILMLIPQSDVSCGSSTEDT